MFECVFPGLHYHYHHDHCYRPRLRSSYTPYCISTPHDRPFCPALQSDTTQCCQISNTFRRFFLDRHNEGSYNITQHTVTLRCIYIQSLVVNQTQHALPDALCTRCIMTPDRAPGTTQDWRTSSNLWRPDTRPIQF